MKHDHPSHADAPWLRVLVATPSDATGAAWALQRQGVASRVLRGKKMRSTAGLFDEIAAALQFPPYFGENWNALDECLADLEWLPADAYSLTILDAVHLLDREPPEVRQTFWDVLGRAAGEWSRPGGSMPRPAKAFRVVVQCTAEEEAHVRAGLPSVGGRPRNS